MFTQNILIFGGIGILGLIIMVLGFRFQNTTRRTIETIGAIAFHVGAFGILYTKVHLILFIAIAALVLSLFILIDPLKLVLFLNPRLYKLTGYLLLFTAFAFSLDHFTGFPVWLWILPVVIYLAPYVIPPLKKQATLVVAIAWILVISYMGLIGYMIYAQYNPTVSTGVLTQVFPKLKLPRNEPSNYLKDYQDDFIEDNSATIKVTKPLETTTVTETTDPAQDQTTSQTTTPEPIEHTTQPKPLPTFREFYDEFEALKKDHEALKEKLNQLENTGTATD